MLNKNSICAVVGKGGTGKTTISGLLLKYLVHQSDVPILAIDADPSNCLGDTLGMEVRETIGDIREEVRGNLDKVPKGMSKQEYFEYQIQSLIVESPRIDLLTMGRPEGPGCYCFVNSILRKCIDTLSKQYQYVIEDCEAGIEHLSRRTTVNIDYLFVISDVSVKGIKTVRVILNIIEKLETVARRKILLFNRVGDNTNGEIIEKLLKYVPKGEFEFIGKLPIDVNVIDYELKGESILNLPVDSPIYKSFTEIINRL